MTPLKKLLRIFSYMQAGEKFLISLLVAILLVSVGQLLFSNFKFVTKNEKGVFAEGFVGKIKILNPLFADFNDADRDMSEMIFSGLMKYDPQKRNFYTDLAESVDRSSNGLKYTFKLRNDVLWHDEKPFTTDDVVFTFKDVIQDPGFKNSILKNSFDGIEVKKTAESTVEFTLKKPNSYFVSNLVVGILPKHLLEGTPIVDLEKSTFNLKPIGTGPYKVSSVNLDSNGDYVDLVEFDKYYDTKPAIPKIRFFTYNNENALTEDAGFMNSMSKINSGGENAKSLATNAKFTLYPYTLNQFTALYFNTDHPILKEKKIRKAIAMILDKSKFIFAGEQRVDSIDLADHKDDTTFAVDKVAGEKILEDIGFKKGADGMRANDKGEKVTFTLLSMSKIPEDLANEIKKQLKEAGIEVIVQVAEGEELIKQINERRYSMLLMKQNMGYNRDAYPLLHSSQANALGLNFSNFKSFRTDGLTEAIRKEPTPKDKEKLLSELSRVISEEIPVVFISTPVYFYALPKATIPFGANSLDFHSDRLSIMPYLTQEPKTEEPAEPVVEETTTTK
ncbi:MAG: ABC transporter substrate-binding protein [Candidatus Gracilibacteria bacterium]